MVAVAVAFLVLQLVAYFAVVRGFRRRSARLALAIGLLGVLAYPPLTFASGLVAYDRLGTAGYVAVLLGAALAVGAAAATLHRWHPLAPPLVLIGAGWLLVVADGLAGFHLQFDTPFGYSPITAARFAGMGNLGFTLLMVTAIVLISAGWPLDRHVGLWPTPLPERAPDRVLVAGSSLAAVSVVVDGLPALGADLGGVLTMVPALAVLLLLMAGRRVRARTAIVVGAAALALVVVAALVDRTRPAADRTHLGRFAQQVLDGDAWLILHRKVDANLQVLSNPGVIAVVAAVVLAVVATWRRSEPFAQIRARVPGAQATVISAIIGAAVGFAANDSGIVVPGMMLAVLVPWFTFVAFEVEPASR